MWGLPLIVLTVIIHVLGLGFISQKAIGIYGDIMKHRTTGAFVVVMGATTLLATILHGLEAAIWTVAYCVIGARPDFRSAMFYSLGAITTYGHQNLYLEERWRLMGAIEALNGWLLFGLSTAFLFWFIQEVSPNNRAARQRPSRRKTPGKCASPRLLGSQWGRNLRHDLSRNTAPSPIASDSSQNGSNRGLSRRNNSGRTANKRDLATISLLLVDCDTCAPRRFDQSVSPCSRGEVECSDMSIMPQEISS